MDNYSTSVYHLTDSGFVELFYGTNENRRYYTLDTNGERILIAITLYYIDGKEVTEEEHDAEVAKYFDYSKSKSFFKDGPVVSVDQATVRQQIKDWDYSILPPEAPAEPDKPTEPETPTQPEMPTEPDTPTSPSDIVTPPTKPETPSIPSTPSDIVPPPTKPTEPDVPTEPDAPEYPDISNDPVVLAGGIPQIVYDAIEEGDWEKAYAMLYSIKTPSKKQKELMSHFVFLPKEILSGIVRINLHNYEFDDEGNLYSDSYYTINREVDKYYYNKDGTLKTVTFYKDQDLWQDFTYFYHGNGTLSLKIYETSWGDQKITTYKYDENGNLVYSESPSEKVSYDKNGNILSLERSYEKLTYTYDEKGNLITEHHQDLTDRGDHRLYSYTYDNEGRVLTKQTDMGKYTYTYDQKGNLLTYTSCYPSGKIDFQTTFFYNEKEQRIETKTLYGDGSTKTTTYERDEKGNMLSETIQQSGKTTKTEYTYDEYGNVLTYKKSSESNVYSYTYELHFFPNSVPTHPETYENYIAE